MTLTREEILATSPGRELDSMIADKVIGMDLVEDTLLQLPRYYLPEYDRTIHRDVPLYSSDIAAAWEIVNNNKRWFSLQWNGMEFICEIGIDSPCRIGAKEAPEAICKCALLAVLNL
ncbi:hypothetical protein D3C75_506960 [compost metagenome]